MKISKILHESEVSGNSLETLKRVIKAKDSISLLKDISGIQKATLILFFNKKIAEIISAIDKEEIIHADLNKWNVFCFEFHEVLNYFISGEGQRQISSQELANICIRTIEIDLHHPIHLLYNHIKEYDNLAANLTESRKLLQKAIQLYKKTNSAEKIPEAYERVIFALWEKLIYFEEPGQSEIREKIVHLIKNYAQKSLSYDRNRNEILLIIAETNHLLNTKQTIKTAIKRYKYLRNSKSEKLPERCVEISDGYFKFWLEEDESIKKFLISRNLADCYLKLSDEKRAKEIMKATLKNLEEWMLPPSGHLSVAVFYRQVKEYEKAMKYLNIFDDVPDKNTKKERDAELARILWFQGERKKSESIYTTLYQSEKNLKYLIELADLFEKSGNFGKALFYTRKIKNITKQKLGSQYFTAEELTKGFGKIIFSEIKILKKMEQYKQAIRVYEYELENIEISFQEGVSILYEIADAYERIGNEEKSVDLLKQTAEFINAKPFRKIGYLRKKTMQRLIVKCLRKNMLDDVLKYAEDFGPGIVKILSTAKYPQDIRHKIAALRHDVEARYPGVNFGKKI